MQASQINFNLTYALRVGEELKRIRPTRIVTTKRNNGPANTSSTIFGRVELAHEETGPFKMDDVLGVFGEYQELVARKAAEDVAAKKRRDEADDLRHRTAAALCRFIGLEEGSSLISSGFSRIEISSEVLPALLARLVDDTAAS